MSTLKTNNIANVAGTASTDVLNVINGSAKAWVNFNGTGTVAIRGSYNVSSITDNGTGAYIVNFTTAMPDSNYSQVVSASSPGVQSSVAMPGDGSVANNTATSSRIYVVSTSGFGAFDPTLAYAAIFR